MSTERDAGEQVDLLYGEGHLKVAVPPRCRALVIRKPAMPIIGDPAGAVARALADPVDSEPVTRLAEKARSACIAICDVTRPVPNGLLLAPLLAALARGGLGPERVRIVVATGLHRPNEGEELRRLVGDDNVLASVRVDNHFARRDDEHVDIGVTSRGTRIRIDRRFVEADLRIVTGLVEPHFMAGYSGGRKVIAPGLAHEETIRIFHSARFLEDPLCTNCVLEGNPLHDDQLEIVRMLGAVHALNVVLDETRRLSLVTFGEIVASHMRAVGFVRRYAEVAVPKRYPVVATSGAGHPLDLTFYQTVKGIVGALGILAPGGDLLIASRCAEGLGSPEFTRSQRRLVADGPAAFCRGLAGKPMADIDEWESELLARALLLSGRIRLQADGLAPDARALTAVECVDDLSAALEQSVARHGTDEVALIPEGPYVIPHVAA